MMPCSSRMGKKEGAAKRGGEGVGAPFSFIGVYSFCFCSFKTCSNQKEPSQIASRGSFPNGHHNQSGDVQGEKNPSAF